MIEKALEFASIAHKGQFRKGTSLPYILHPIEASVIVSRITDNQDLICGALLHDVIEDTLFSYEDILKTFNKNIADLVLSESDNKSKSWQERKIETLEKLKNSSIDTKIVALGDKLSNMRAIFSDYKKLKEELWKKFKVKDKNLIGWYYKGLADSLKDLSYTDEFKEFNTLVESVFN